MADAECGARHKAAGHDSGQDHERAGDRAVADRVRRLRSVQVLADQQRDRDRQEDRERPPRRVGQRVDDGDAEAGQSDHDDEEDGDHGRDARQRRDLGARDLRQRLPVTPHRRRQRDEVVHRPAQDDAEGEPQQARQIPELRRQHRPDQRPGPGDGREVMPEEHPLVGRDVVLPVLEPMRRRDAGVIERHHLRGEESRVVAIPDRRHSEEEEDERKGVHGCGVDSKGDRSRR